mgnify:CR=1 FL=1
MFDHYYNYEFLNRFLELTKIHHKIIMVCWYTLYFVLLVLVFKNSEQLATGQVKVERVLER